MSLLSSRVPLSLLALLTAWTAGPACQSGEDNLSGVSATVATSVTTLPVTSTDGTGILPTGDGSDSDSNGTSNSGSNSASTSGPGSDSNTSDSPTGTAGSASTTSGLKLDVGSADLGIDTGGTETGCTAVDLVFVIDNSVSMGDYQNALSLAFPGFADAIIETLPPGTNLHVGVTSTTMGDSNSGSTTNCKATGDNMQPQEFFYQTPDMGNNGINGAQGRLYDAGGMYFYNINTDAGPAEVAALKTWFSQAAKIGEGGSQIEMSAAAAGWVADPANAATNAGFIRDEGAVLALFFLQDEPDQTPWTIDGMPGGLAMRDKLAGAKAGCGGEMCIIGGGFVNTNCIDQVPLGDLLDNLGAPAVIDELPDENLAEDFPEMAAEEMNQLLRDTLSAVIAQKCEEIAPPR